MEERDVLLQVFLFFFQDPLLEVEEVEGVWVVDGLPLQPIHEVGKILRNLVPDEYTVYHVTAKQSHLYLVSKVRLYALVFVNCFEDVGSR